ncbi:LCP family protein [Lactococcus allomyrinae]|uniref:LytR family transcriptional regulator n=1 Tax=Lactococcus allomyrinae TaxID=2419773 RepID=A0A387BFT4_9LACT|nr:LCP family protein [Lactococcus allomyrinae]AYF99985.1 LytR family transcriptional regulator [Lactococcus allomyrinae]
MAHKSKSHHRHHRRKKHLALKIILSVIITLILIIGAAAFGIYKNIESTFSSSYAKSSATTPINFSKSKPFTTLIIETNTVNGENSCFAAVLVATNAQTKQTTFLNFPVTATLPNQITIADSYAKGGKNAVLNDIHKSLSLPINKIVQIDIDKIGEIVEATGGITLQNPTAFVSEGYQFNRGTLHLNTTKEVQAYLSLVDKNDQQALITRIQNVSMALYGNIQKLTKAKNLSNFNYYRNILYSFSDTVKTNISFNEFKEILIHYNKALLTTSKLNLHTTKQDGNEIITNNELTTVKNLFLTSLQQ